MYKSLFFYETQNVNFLKNILATVFLIMKVNGDSLSSSNITIKYITIVYTIVTLMSFQTSMSFSTMLNTKEDILKSAGNLTVDGPHWLP